MAKFKKRPKNFSQLKNYFESGRISAIDAVTALSGFISIAEYDEITVEEVVEMQDYKEMLEKRIKEGKPGKIDEIAELEGLGGDVLDKVNDPDSVKAVDEIVAETDFSDDGLPENVSELDSDESKNNDPIPEIPPLDTSDVDKDLLDAIASVDAVVPTGDDKKTINYGPTPVAPTGDEKNNIDYDPTHDASAVEDQNTDKKDITNFSEIDDMFKDWQEEIDKIETEIGYTPLSDAAKDEIGEFVDTEAKKLGLDAQLTEIEAETVAVSQAHATISTAASLKKGKDSSLDSKKVLEEIRTKRKDSIAERREEAKSVDYLGKFGELIKSGYEKAKGLFGKVFGAFGKDGKARNAINAGIGEIVAAPGNIKDNVVYGASAVKKGFVGAKDSVVAKASSAKRNIKGFAKDIGAVIKSDSKSVREGKVVLTGPKEDLALAIGKGIRKIGSAAKTTGSVLATVGMVASAPVWGPVVIARKTPDFVLKVSKKMKEKRLTRQIKSIDDKIKKISQKKTLLESQITNQQALKAKLERERNGKTQDDSEVPEV